MGVIHSRSTPPADSPAHASRATVRPARADRPQHQRGYARLTWLSTETTRFSRVRCICLVKEAPFQPQSTVRFSLHHLGKARQAGSGGLPPAHTREIAWSCTCAVPALGQAARLHPGVPSAGAVQHPLQLGFTGGESNCDQGTTIVVTKHNLGDSMNPLRTTWGWACSRSHF